MPQHFLERDSLWKFPPAIIAEQTLLIHEFDFLSILVRIFAFGIKFPPGDLRSFLKIRTAVFSNKFRFTEQAASESKEKQTQKFWASLLANEQNQLQRRRMLGIRYSMVKIFFDKVGVEINR